MRCLVRVIARLTGQWQMSVEQGGMKISRDKSKKLGQNASIVK
jgi:hypothetical protein